MYKVDSSSHAERQLKKLPKDIQERLSPKISSLENHPHVPHVDKLEGSKRNDWRLRVGDWRILYEVDNSTRQILVYSIAARKEAY